MKRLFVDANILLDALLERAHDPEEAMRLLALGAQRKVILVTTAMSLGQVFYLLQKKRSSRRPGPLLNAVRATMVDLMACVEIVPVLKSHIMQSLNGPFVDLEDGSQFAAVSASGKLDGVVTRDVKDFRGRVTVPVLSAAQALKLVGWKAR